MLDHTKFLLSFVELEKICKEKNFDNKTTTCLKRLFTSIWALYTPSDDILEEFSREEYVESILEKLRQTDDIRILELKEMLKDPKSILHSHITKVPFGMEEKTIRLSKQEEGFILDNNGEYYLPANGVCRGGKIIELVDYAETTATLQHELQHVDQNYVYPSEFPFASDILEMLCEGEAEYHRCLLEPISDFSPIEESHTYDIYYLVYTLLILSIPKEMRDSWNKIVNRYPNDYIFSEIFKSITDSKENRNSFSHIFALATLIVASGNPENTKEVFNTSVETSIKRCSKKVKHWNNGISQRLKVDKKDTLETLQYLTKEVSEDLKILQDPDLLQKKYEKAIADEKEFIASEPEEKQEELLERLQSVTLENFEALLIKEVTERKELIRKYQDEKERSPQEILGEIAYRKYQYYQFGMQLSKDIQVLLSQNLTFKEIFGQFVESVESHLTESKDPRLDEKLSFIKKVKMNCLVNSKQI